MTDKEISSCILTIDTLRRLAVNVNGVIDVIDDQNCHKIIELLKQSRDGSETSSHDEKHILQGCIALMGEMVEYFREYLDFIGFEPEFDEDKMPFVMSYFHIVQRLFLWNTHHSGGNSTRTKCYELGIEDSSKQVEFYLWEDEE